MHWLSSEKNRGDADEGDGIKKQTSEEEEEEEEKEKVEKVQQKVAKVENKKGRARRWWKSEKRMCKEEEVKREQVVEEVEVTAHKHITCFHDNHMA